MPTAYLFSPERWTSTPIQRRHNPLTGLVEGDDSGYRKIRTLSSNDSPLVIPAVLARPSYDGVDEYGNKNPSISLPGGLSEGKLVVRESVARALEDADRLLQTVFGGALRMCALDGFRSWRRQAAGFTRMLRLHLNRFGLGPERVDSDVGTFLRAAALADGTFAWVNVGTDSSEYDATIQDLRRDEDLRRQLESYASTLSNDGVTAATLNEAFWQYVTVSANTGMGRVGNRVPLDFETNAHAGGGAVDIMLVDKDGRPISIVPFDYPGEEAGMDFAERDENYDVYQARASGDSELGKLLRAHLTSLGYSTPTKFTRADWSHFRDVNRIRYHLGMSKGWTYYSSAHGGENWHFEPANIDYDARTGKVINAEPLTSSSFPNSGNPGHTLQKLGRDATAVWGGGSGHALARKLGMDE